MRKKLWRLAAAAAALLFTIGAIFAAMRPAYVKESLDILFRNELHIEEKDSRPNKK